MATRRSRTAETPFRRLLRRAIWCACAVAVLAFAVEGGEYGTSDVFRQQSRKRVLDAEVAALRTQVDSLRVEFSSVSRDTVRLERIAREEFGMVRGDKELVYLTRTPRAAADSVAQRDSSPGAPRG